ncbi:MAG TPA: dienelactone hydrolase family protein [Candidatus Aquilonibacter sp.]|nr:dienelactone hydrolase family protein [Candidatus Aquilonibacter sp.]
MGQTEIANAKVELVVSDGTRMNAYVARPRETATHAGMLLFQEAFGVNHHIRGVADRLAAEGYVVIAPELFHRTAPPGFEGSYTDFSAIMPHFQAVTAENVEKDVRSAYEWLHSNSEVQPDNIACVGFCMGGRVSFIANCVLPLRAAVSFYGGGIAPGLLDRAAKLHAPMLLIWGGKDKNITPEHRRAVSEALTAAQKIYVSAEFSRADHGFFCDERASYEPHSARQAWALTLEFLRS